MSKLSDALTAVQAAAKQAKALVVVEDALLTAANLEASVRENSAELSRLKGECEAAKREKATAEYAAAEVKKTSEAQARAVKSRAEVEAKVLVDDAKAAAAKSVDIALKRCQDADSQIANASRRADDLRKVCDALEVRRDTLTAEVSKLKDKFKQLVA